MSGLEILGLVAGVLCAVRILPEIPKAWRRGLAGRKREEVVAKMGARPARTQGIEIMKRFGRSQSKRIEGRDNGHALVISDHHLRIHETQMAAQKDTNQLYARILDNTARVHKAQTVVQIDTNHLHAIMSENAFRAYEYGLTTVLDVVATGHRQYESQRMMTVCCMAIITILVYLLGTTTGENNLLRAMLQSHLGVEVPVTPFPPVTQSPPAFKVQDRQPWSALAWLWCTQFVEQPDHIFVAGNARLVARAVFVMVTGYQLLLLTGRIKSGVKFAPTRVGYMVITAGLAANTGAGLAATIDFLKETQDFVSWIPMYICLNLTWALCLLRADGSLGNI